MKLKLTINKFENIKRMLESSDEENHIVALSILEEQDFLENITFILLLKKASNCKNNFWKEHAPNIFHKISSIKSLDVTKVFTYKDILRALREMDAPQDQIIFYLDAFSLYLKDQLASLGYDFIDKLEFNIKLKPEYE